MKSAKRRYFRRRELDNGVTRAPLMALVDILFSAVGIFLIFISLNAVIRTRANMPPAQADMVIVCAPEQKYKLYTHEKPMGADIQSDRLRTAMAEMLSGREQSVALMIAFSSVSFHEADKVEEIAAELTRKGRESGDPAVGFETMIWPLSDEDSQVSAAISDLVKMMNKRYASSESENDHKHKH